MAYYNTINYRTPSSVYKEKEYDEKKGAYSSQIADAQRLLNQQIKNKPAEYQSLYQSQINDTINSIANRKPFTYDLNADAMFKQFKNQYVGMGQQAMTDTIGQASALTGGYGNSYAVTAGNQAYQQHLNNLNNIVPELYNSAYSRYQDEGVNMQNLLNMYQTQDSLDYAKYQDAYANWQNDRNYYAGELSTLRGLNQDAWAQNESNRYNANNLDWNNYYTAQNYNLDSYKQAVAEDQFNANQALQYAQLAEEQRQYDLNLKEEQRQFDVSQKSNDSTRYVKQVNKLEHNKNVVNFKESMPTVAEFGKMNYGGMSYSEYIEMQLDNYTKLSDEEKLYLMDYYGI